MLFIQVLDSKEIFCNYSLTHKFTTSISVSRSKSIGTTDRNARGNFMSQALIAKDRL